MRQDDPTARPSRPSSSNMRPQSRESTASTHSAATQPHVDANNEFNDMAGLYAQAWPQMTNLQQGQQGYQSQAAQPGQLGPGQSPGENLLILQQANNPDPSATHPFQMSSMNNHPAASQFAHHQMSSQQLHQAHQAQVQQQMQAQQQQMHAQPHMQPHQQIFPSQGWNDNTLDNDTSLADTTSNPTTGGKGSKAKSSKKRSNANNDGEMRALFETNRESKLEDVAEDLRTNERGPNAERKRQLYAMLWLASSCTVSAHSVPRSRVYHTYAAQCTDDRLMVLNPASFGKLVRVVFPDIKTRRLGVRGESKYHYCNFELRNPPSEEIIAALEGSAPAPEAAAQAPEFDFNTPPAQSKDDIPTPEAAPNPQLTDMAPRANHGSRTYYRHVIPKINTKEAKEIASTKVPFTLKLPTEAETTYDVNQPLTLPPIEPFLPPHTDRDTANSLFVLYRAQCTSIAENFRFIKEKAFFHLYTSFHGTLTMPVQKLFAHPSIAPWIEECDMALYHRLTKITFGNSLKVMPLKVTNRLKGISERLVDHIVESFRGQPMHVIRAKVMPAGIFAGILKRMMQVNITAHAAASSMAVEANRDQMYADWVEYIDPREVAQAVPGRGMNDVADVLIREMRRLVNPKNFRLDGEGMDLDTSASTAGSENLAGTAVDRLRNFALSLPERFPYASHEDIVWCAERVGTAMMRQLTIRGGNSFSAWWVAKTFLDEDVLFLAEVGGFLQTKRLREERAGPRAAPASVAREDGHGLKDTTGDKAGAGAVTSGTTEKRGSLASLGRSDRAPFPPKSSQAAGKGHTAGEVHEDSGLGIPTPETDFPMDKFTFTEGDNAELGYQS